MAGKSIKVDLKADMRQVDRALREVTKRGADLEPALKIIGGMAHESIVRNFEEGGRPDPWVPSERATEKGGQTLVDIGNMHDGIHYTVSGKSVKVSTRHPAAALHHFGGTVKEHTITAKRGKALAIPTAGGVIFRKSATIPEFEMPARPFLLLQDEDPPEMLRQLEDYLLQGVNG